MITWPGIIEAYRDRLPVSDATPVVTLLEGATPLIPAPHLSEVVGRKVLLKYDGVNPTGSFTTQYDWPKYCCLRADRSGRFRSGSFRAELETRLSDKVAIDWRPVVSVAESVSVI